MKKLDSIGTQIFVISCPHKTMLNIYLDEWYCPHCKRFIQGAEVGDLTIQHLENGEIKVTGKGKWMPEETED